MAAERRGRLLGALGAVGLAILVVGALPAGQDVAEAQVAGTNTPLPTATATFVWQISDPQTNNRLSVDPFSQKFEFVPARTPGVPPIPTISGVSVDMQFSYQRVTWKYSRPNQPCPTPTPGPSDTPTPRRRSAAARCPVFVWGTIDRVRHTVRATYMQRNPATGLTVRYVDERDTILSLPSAPAPAVIIRDFNLLPRVKILTDSAQRVSFQNEGEWPCSITFSREPGPVDLTTSRKLGYDVGMVQRGRFTTPFPYLAATPTTTTTPSPQRVWDPGTYDYEVTCQGKRVGGQIVVKD